MKTLIKILLLVIIAAASTNAIAQTDAPKDLPLYQNATADGDDSKGGASHLDANIRDTIDAQLQNLRSLYSAGKYHDALQLSQEIDNRYPLKKAETLTRLKYTLAANKDLDNDAVADSIAKQYLQKDPFYNPETDDDAPVSFKRVLKNYYTTPKYSVWAAVGKNTVEPFNDTIRTIIDTVTNARTPEYNITGFFVQLGFEYRPLKIVSISVAPALTSYNIERSIDRYVQEDKVVATFYYNESSTVFSLPMFVEAGLHLKREFFVPSIYAGAQIKYIINAEYKAYTDAVGIRTEIPAQKEDTGIKNRLNYSILGGIRLNINHRRMTYFADLGMSLDMLPYNDPSKKYQNYDLLYQHFHIPDIYQMLEYTVKVGVKVNLQYKTIAKYNYGY